MSRLTFSRLIFLLTILLWLPGCLSHDLQTGLSEQEAQEIIVLLKKHGLEAYKSPAVEDRETTWSVSVRGGEQNLFLAWRILQENGLPRSEARGLADVFSESGLIPTANEEKAKILVGLAGDLRSTLESVPGVIDSRVHLVLPDNSPLLTEEQRKPATASVLIKYQQDEPPLLPEEIKILVAQSVEGLDPENVAVVSKRIEPTPITPQELEWTLGDQEVTLTALVLTIVLLVLALLLALQNRKQRSHIQTLRRQLRVSTLNPSDSSDATAEPAS